MNQTSGPQICFMLELPRKLEEALPGSTLEDSDLIGLGYNLASEFFPLI